MFKKYVVSVGLLGSTIENEKVLYISNDSIPRNTEIGFLFFPFSIGYIVQMSESFVVTPALGINLNDSYLMKDEEKRLNISPDFNDTKGTHIEIAFDYYWERWYRKNGFLNGSAICTGFEIGYSINDISKIRNDFGNGFFYMNLRFPIIASHAKRDFAFLENLR